MKRFVLQPLYAGWVLLTFVITVLIAFPFIVLLSLGNNYKSRRMILSLIRGWSYIWLPMIGMRVTVKGSVPDDKKYVIVANHISYMDTLVIFPSIKGYFRPLGKKEIVKIPVLGYIYKQVVIMVDRSSQFSRAKSMRLMVRSLRKEGNILIFPEGTFNETPAPLKSFYDGAFRLAVNSGAEILPLILPDTHERWHYSGWWKLWPGKNRAIFLPPISPEGYSLETISLLKDKVYQTMEAAMIEYCDYLK